MPVTISQGFNETDLPAAAELYDDAFGVKLGIAIPDRGQRLSVLEHGFVPRFCFVAQMDGKLVGLAGFKMEAGSFTGGLGAQSLRKQLGWPKSIRAMIVLSLFERSHTDGELLMDGIAVSREHRGEGIGSELIRHLKAHAKAEGYKTLRLDVINTNPAARKLYERLGFKPTKTQHFRYLKWLLGFSTATTMVCDL